VIYSVGSVYGKLVGEAFSGNELTENEIKELFVKELLNKKMALAIFLILVIHRTRFKRQ
jgi:hypothetical protein